MCPEFAEFFKKKTIFGLDVHEAFTQILRIHLILACVLVFATFFRSLGTPTEAHGGLVDFMLRLLLAIAIDRGCLNWSHKWGGFFYFLFTYVMVLQTFMAARMGWNLVHSIEALAHNHHFFVECAAIPTLFGFSLLSAVAALRSLNNPDGDELPC
ncbi:hypothetical protein M3Y99_01625700 [Aphelenchoides fujianensis]|nr:hypothetical protein M3Y99_01625700 [Aphelenchoides fujianensis]